MCATAKNPGKVFALENVDIASAYTRELIILSHLFNIQQSMVDCNVILIFYNVL